MACLDLVTLFALASGARARTKLNSQGKDLYRLAGDLMTVLVYSVFGSNCHARRRAIVGRENNNMRLGNLFLDVAEISRD